MKVSLKILVLLLGPLILALLGAFGYMWIEGWSFSDSIYMAVITLTTTGFNEVHTLSAVGRWFTVVLLVLGVGIFAYTLTTVVQNIIESQFGHLMGRRRMDKRIQKLRGHTVICGFGKIGKTIAEQLTRAKKACVIIEKDPVLVDTLMAGDYLYVIGDSTDDEVLLMAGITEANSLVSVVTSDAENVFITLSARSLNKTIYIIARMYEESAEAKLMKAGANKVISPYNLTSVKITQSIINPAVGDFLEIISEDQTIDFQLGDIKITPQSSCLDQTLLSSNLRSYGLIIVGIKKESGQLIFAPRPQEKIELGDRLIALGSGSALSRVIEEQLIT